MGERVHLAASQRTMHFMAGAGDMVYRIGPLANVAAAIGIAMLDEASIRGDRDVGQDCVGLAFTDQRRSPTYCTITAV